MQTTAEQNAFDPPLWRSFWAFAGAITAIRIVILFISQAELGPDEAQYWYWSRDLAYGYFSKPPVIAWAIAATTAVFGNEEWAVRLSAPLFHFGAAGFLYALACNLYDRRIAFWTGLGWLTIPGVILSSFIIATDAPLLFCWSGALYFLFRILNDEKSATIDFARLGAMIGIGLMSKYAMMYFVAALAPALLLRPVRDKLLTKPLALTALVALVIFIPNVIWNFQNDFQTLSHTAANANWGASLKPLSLATFVAEQFLVFGVIIFSAILAAGYKLLRTPRRADYTAIILLIFAATPLVIVATQAFISRAHANWAAAAYPAAMLLATAFLFQAGKGWLAKASVAVHGFIFLAFSIAMANFGLIDRLGLSNAVKDLRGWEAQTAAIVEQGLDYDAILVDDRYLISEMLYHQYEAAGQIFAIDPNAHISNHFEAFKAFDPKLHKYTLFVTTRDDAAHVDYRFHSIERVGSVEADIGGGKARRYGLFAISDYFGPGAD
jgi:4-amino-4-deoxy-L-arabinose transferase-like glycosyltransferase